MSNYIAIKCDGCGKDVFGYSTMDYAELRELISSSGWEWKPSGAVDLCPFCAARRKAKEQAEAKPK